MASKGKLVHFPFYPETERTEQDGSLLAARLHYKNRSVLKKQSSAGKLVFMCAHLPTGHRCTFKTKRVRVDRLVHLHSEHLTRRPPGIEFSLPDIKSESLMQIKDISGSSARPRLCSLVPKLMDTPPH